MTKPHVNDIKNVHKNVERTNQLFASRKKLSDHMRFPKIPSTTPK